MNTQYDLRNQDLLMNTGEKAYTLKIHDLPKDEKPREKLLKYGPEGLGLNELLAVVLNTGTKKEDVLQMSSRIVKEYGERSIASSKSAKKVHEDLSIPLGKAQQIVALIEIGRRLFDRNKNSIAIIRTPKDVYEYVKDIRDLPKEHLRGIYLDSHHRVIHDEVISIGTVNSSIIHPREVFKPAIEYSAAAIVLAHNHPSGVADPSKADRDVTEQLVATGKVLGISLLDHVIVTRDHYKSIDINYD